MARIDLRSDTVTQPTDAMRAAMAAAEVGDDVFGDDPTINALEARAAELLGKDAALFVASGTMGNLVSLMAHLPRGYEAIAGASTHTVMDEAGGHAVAVGATDRALAERAAGAVDPAEDADAWRAPTHFHQPLTGLGGLDQTHHPPGRRPPRVPPGPAHPPRRGPPLPPCSGRPPGRRSPEPGVPPRRGGCPSCRAAGAPGAAPAAPAAPRDSAPFCLSKAGSAPLPAVGGASG